MSAPGDELNPYAPPEADLVNTVVPPSSELAELEAIRRKYLSHEASVKSIGSLFDLSAVIAAVVVVVATFTAVQGVRQMDSTMVAGILVWVVALGFCVALGRGLNGLKPWARWVTVVMTALSLFSSIAGVGILLAFGARPIPVSILALIGQSLIPSYILYLLISRKGSYVFSHEYAAIIRATPHIKYKTSCILKVALGLLVVFLILIFVGALVARR